MQTPSVEAPNYFGKDLEAMSFARNYHRWIVRELTPYLGEQVAEVGAGTGQLSELLEPLVRRLVAFEPSKNMYPVLAERLQRSDKAETVNSFLGQARAAVGEGFDSVVYVNVLEHIEDDRAELALAHRALRPGGHLLVYVPALSFLYSELDRSVGHFRRYQKKQLVGLARQSGFTVVSARYFDMLGILPWFVVYVLLKKTIRPGDVSLYDRLVVPVMRSLEGIIAPPIGKNLLLVARKD